MQGFDPDVRLRLTRYLSGDCPVAEAAELERWLAADPARQRELDALRRLWEASAGLPPSDRVDEMWRDLTRQMHSSEPRQSTVTKPLPPPMLMLPSRANRRRAGWQRWGVGLAAAASLALAVYGIRAYDLREQSRTAAVQALASPKEYRTVRGQRAVVQLGDGTRVELGVASVLRVYPFASGRRDVELAGEAVFEVVHDSKRPFTVRSGNALIEDLGTRFGVRAYPDDERVRVVVAEGKVALRADALRRDTLRPDTTAVLLPGDLATIDGGGRTLIRHGVIPETYFSWISGRLDFANTTLAEVAADLQRWYDVEITFATPSLGTRRVTVNMPMSSLTDVLDAITAPLGVVYALHGSVVSLRTR